MIMQQKPVTILKDADGQAVGVMVETLDERFALELHPIDGGKEYLWDEAMERLKELGKEGFNEKQGKIIAVYHEEIDAALEEAGGDKLGWEWAVGAFNGSNAWLYYPVRGALGGSSKCDSSPVRALLASKQIESLIGPRRLSGAVEIFPDKEATAQDITNTLYTIKDYAYGYQIQGSTITIVDAISNDESRKTTHLRESKIHASQFGDYIAKRIERLSKRGGINEES